jgi:hypothetical protein
VRSHTHHHEYVGRSDGVLHALSVGR